MLASLSQFHFLRPEWFLAMIPVVLLLLWLRFEKSAQGDWHSLIPEHLLKHIIHEQLGGSSRQALTLLALLWTLCVIALAGPTWSKLPQPVYEKIAARVYILDLSYSMYAGDLKPDRISRARLKLIDMLKNKREGLSALVVFSGNSHVVTPLTNDTNTIVSLVPALEPDIMPNIGSNPSEAVQKALSLLSNTKVEQGQIILITDEITDQHIAPINALMESSPYSLSILGLGTEEGAPIKMPNGQFLKDGNKIVVPKLDHSTLENLATNNKGIYVSIQQNDNDIQALQADTLVNTQDAREGSQQFDIWFEAGQWLMFPILALATLAFRRGWILSLMLSTILFSPISTNKLYAQQTQTEQANNKSQKESTLINNTRETLASWFKTGDQRGFEQFKNQDFQEAAKLFTNDNWRGASLFYSGQFAQASEIFNADQNNIKTKQSSTWYNKANALAFAGDLDGALDAYDKSLALDPDNEDAAFNKQLVQDLKKQQEQQEHQNQQQEQSQQGEQDQQENQEKNGDTSDSENKQQNQSDQQDKSQDSEKSQQESEQQESDQQQDAESQSESEAEQDADEKQEQNNDQQSDSKQNQGEQEEAETDEEKQKQSETEMNNEEQRESEQQQSAMEESALDREKQQALEQWLRQVPDDPSGLLRRKFQLEHQRNRNNQNTNQQAW